MKPRHVRRLVVCFIIVALMLLAASGMLSILDSYNLTGNKISEDVFPDDPGGFKRFQNELVRRKMEEMQERSTINVTVVSRRSTNSEDLVEVSEDDAHKFIRRATRWNEARLQRVQEVCTAHNLGLYRSSARAPDFKLPPTPQYSVFYYDLNHRMSWCPLYKAGSSSWLYNLCILGGYSEQELRDSTEQLSTLARKAYPELDYPEAEEALRDTRKLLVVRHPFARILSAYRDKLENRVARAEHGTAHFYRKYGSKIVRKYRNGGARTPTNTLVRKDQVVVDPNKELPAGDEPTFKEFVQYLIDLDLASYADDHWIPYYLYCTPCLLNYNIIGKVETYVEDQVYMIRALGVQDQIRPRWRHRTNYQTVTTSEGTNLQDSDSTLSISSEIDDIAKKYFSQITVSELISLYEKYRLDFELFDYSIDDYLPYVMADK